MKKILLLVLVLVTMLMSACDENLSGDAVGALKAVELEPTLELDKPVTVISTYAACVYANGGATCQEIRGVSPDECTTGSDCLSQFSCYEDDGYNIYEKGYARLNEYNFDECKNDNGGLIETFCEDTFYDEERILLPIGNVDVEYQIKRIGGPGDVLRLYRTEIGSQEWLVDENNYAYVKLDGETFIFQTNPAQGTVKIIGGDLARVSRDDIYCDLGCDNGACNNESTTTTTTTTSTTTTTTEPIEDWCFDSDGGHQKYIFGFVNSTVNGSYSDYCVNSDGVMEYYCSFNSASGYYTLCDFGCENGACLQENSTNVTSCYDTDDAQGVMEAYTKGSTILTFTDGSIDMVTDFCSGNNLNEYNCLNLDRITSFVTCNMGCTDGACNYLPSECDINGDGQQTTIDWDYYQEVLGWWTTQDLRFDWNNDGSVTLSDNGLFSSLLQEPGWCYNTLYPLLLNITNITEPFCVDTDNHNIFDMNEVEYGDILGNEFIVEDSCHEIEPGYLTRVVEGVCTQGGVVDQTFTAGDLTTIPIGSYDVDVEVIGVNTINETATININGEQKIVSESQSLVIGGVNVFVRDIFAYTAPVTSGAVRLILYYHGDTYDYFEADCPSGYDCLSGACQLNFTETPVECTDGDNGISIFTFDQVEIEGGPVPTVMPDYCQGDYLYEAHCGVIEYLYLEAGQIKPVTLNGQTFDVELLGVNSADNSGTIKVNGEPAIVNRYENRVIGGVRVYIKKVGIYDPPLTVGYMGLLFIEDSEEGNRTQILCPNGCQNGACLEEVQNECIDTDYGIDIYTHGGIDGYTESGSHIIAIDYCGYNNDVYEWYCDNGYVKNISQYCPNGTECYNGYCRLEPVTCSDTDGGLSYYTFGSAQLSNETYNESDICVSGRLFEKYCNDGPTPDIGTDYHTCPAGCYNGECQDYCTDSDGYNNTYVAGFVEHNEVSYNDYCIDNYNLVEMYCDGVQREEQTMRCFYGCANGHCLSAYPGVELVTQYMSVRPYYMSEGELVNVTFNYRNEGENESGPIQVRTCFDDDCRIDTVSSLGTMAYGEFIREDNIYNVIPVSIQLDPYNLIPEVDDYNNNNYTRLVGPRFCNETDDGVDYYNRGSVSGFSGYGYYTREDRCNTYYIGRITEYSCRADGSYTSTSYTCPNGCQNGACVPDVTLTCEDSDAGVDVYNYGFVNGTNESGYYTFGDSCIGMGDLNERFCNGGRADSEIIHCENGCANGACIEPSNLTFYWTECVETYTQSCAEICAARGDTCSDGCYRGNFGNDIWASSATFPNAGLCSYSIWRSVPEEPGSCTQKNDIYQSIDTKCCCGTEGDAPLYTAKSDIIKQIKEVELI